MKNILHHVYYFDAYLECIHIAAILHILYPMVSVSYHDSSPAQHHKGSEKSCMIFKTTFYTMIMVKNIVCPIVVCYTI